MLLARKVNLKVIITNDFRKRYIAQLKSLESEVKVELEKIKSTEQQLLLKVQNLDYNYVMQLREQLEREKSAREQTLKELEARTKEIDSVPDGAEFPQGQIEGLVDVKEGDNLENKLGRSEIVIKDGVIVKVIEG